MRRADNEARLERQRKWFEAGLQRERVVAARIAEENVRRETDGLNFDRNMDVGGEERRGEPPRYEEAVPLRTLETAVVR